jgi:hypothetical protein
MIDTAKSPQETIDKILKTENLADVIDLKKVKESYKALVLLIHPDRCSLPKASDAMAKLNMLKKKFEEGIELKDDAGTFNTNDYVVRFKGNKEANLKSLANYNVIKAYKELARYIPQSMVMDGDDLVVTLNARAVSVSNLTLPQEHVNWILSRMIEFSVYLNSMGYMHGGITPESVFVEPESHGIQIVSFYHLTRIGERVKTYSGAHKNWYPSSMFDTKVASSKVDLELAKKVAICLLGDRSGSGIKLKKTHNEAFINFVISQHANSAECFTKYREMLKANFPTKFHVLNI